MQHSGQGPKGIRISRAVAITEVAILRADLTGVCGNTDQKSLAALYIAGRLYFAPASACPEGCTGFLKGRDLARLNAGSDRASVERDIVELEPNRLAAFSAGSDRHIEEQSLCLKGPP